MNRIYLSSPHMGGQEQAFVKEAFDTNWIAPLGANVEGFEKDLARYTGAAHAAALVSGTSAIHLALIMLGVTQGDEVLCSSFTFSASANPIVYQGATPIFVESEADTWNICPDALETAIKARLAKGSRPKALILVHLYGMPSKMDDIVSICERYDIPLIEDAAEALGSSYNGQALGTFGIMGILSFNGNKIITTSGGGALISDSEELVKKARFLATQARDNAPHYQHSHIGYNYRMSNVVAGIGRGQMLVLDERIDMRRKHFERYQAFFRDVPGVKVTPLEQKPMLSNRWLSTVLIDPKETAGLDRETVRTKLETFNIESRPLWKPLHLQPIFINCPYYGDGLSAKLFEQGLCLPSGSNMTENDVERIESALASIFKLEAAAV